MHDGVLFAQYSNCHHELYYESCEIYGDDPDDSEQAISRLANSGEVTWDSTHSPSIGDDSTSQSDFLYDQQKKGGWVNNKKVKWTTDKKPPSLPTHLLPPPSTPRINGLPAAVEAQLRSYFGRTHVDADEVTDNNVDDDADYGEPIDDADYGELVNNELFSAIDQEIGPTGTTIMHDGVLFAQY